MRKIAVEEAFIIPEIVDRLSDLGSALASGPGKAFILAVIQRKLNVRGRSLLDDLLDIGDQRLADMDQHGVDVQVLSITSPGVQMFDADTACEMATLANDRLAEAVERHPTRFAGLGCFAPHAPKRAAAEIERVMTTLKLNGLIVNSHTNNEYLDDPKYWPVLEAAEAFDAPLYIHPRGASDLLSGPLRDYGLQGAMWGFGVETSTHAVRLMTSGVLDRFPKLRICLGHMGEGIPFWLWRLDRMHDRGRDLGLTVKTDLSMEEYFLRNFHVTTSGVEDPLALEYSIRKLGAERVLWAIDHPYESTASATAFIDQAPLDKETKAKVAYQNAEALFRIAPAT
jgi:5-carboxyvanillate decarboxylase